MGKFVIHGVLVEEPYRSVTSSGIDTVRLIVEEKFSNAFNKEIINIYAVDFTGKVANAVPNTRLIGSPVVIEGSIKGREYHEKYYNDLAGETLTIIDVNAFSNRENAPSKQEEREQASELPIGTNLDSIAIEDDDLPF